MYEKITEVKILGEGYQLMELARSKYKESRQKVLVRYAKMTGNYEESISKYFDNKIVKNEKFKEILVKDLGKPYDQLIKTVEYQIKTYIEGVRDNIYLYNEGEDLINLEQLIQEAQCYKMPYLEVMAIGNLGRFKANLRLNGEAKTILNETIESAKKQGYWDLVLYYHTNLAYVENLEGKHSEARKRLRKVEGLIVEYSIDNRMVIYQYWYIYAYTMMKIGRSLYPSARKKFERAIYYAEDMDNEVKCLVTIARLYINEKKYKKALEIYENALRICNRTFHIKVTVLNNIANLYHDIGEHEKAKEYIEKAIYLMPKNLNINRKIAIYDTYISLEENCDKIMEVVLKFLDETSKITENRYYVYKCIDDFIRKLRASKRYNMLLKLGDILMDHIEKGVKEEDLKDFRARLGSIFLILIKEGGYRYEKEISIDAVNDSSD